MAHFIGEKPIQLNWADMEDLCLVNAKLETVANYFKCSPDTIVKAIKRETHCKNFTVYKEYILAKTQVKLMKAQLDSAIKYRNTEMLKWLGKNILGQKDKLDFSSTQDVNINILQHKDIKEVIQIDPFRVEVKDGALPQLREADSSPSDVNEAGPEHTEREGHIDSGDQDSSERG